MQRRRVPRRGAAARPERAHRRPARERRARWRAAGDAPDGQPRPGPTGAARRPTASPSSPSARPTCCNSAIARRSSMPTTTRSPTPTACWPARSAGCSSSARHVRAADAASPTTASRWARTGCTCGLPYAVAPREQTHVAMVAWTPSAERRQCLAAQRDAPLSHDHMFHTVAGALGIPRQRVPAPRSTCSRPAARPEQIGSEQLGLPGRAGAAEQREVELMAPRFRPRRAGLVERWRSSRAQTPSPVMRVPKFASLSRPPRISRRRAITRSARNGSGAPASPGRSGSPPRAGAARWRRRSFTGLRRRLERPARAR